MEYISIENFKEEINNINVGQKIFIEMSQKICKNIEFIGFKKISYENLFLSYINKSQELNDVVTTSFNLEKFLNLYTELCFNEKEIIKNSVINLIGFNNYVFLIKNKINFEIDLLLNQLVIYKISIRQPIRSIPNLINILKKGEK